MHRFRAWVRLGIMAIACFAVLILAACTADVTNDTTPEPGETIEQPEEPPSAGNEDPEYPDGQHEDDFNREERDAVFSLFDIEVGDMVAGLRVEAIESAEGDDDARRDPHNAVVRFSGRKQISGRFTYYPPQEEFVGGSICMLIGDGVAAGLPHMAEDTRFTWFCFTNLDDAVAVFKEPSAGTATVVIDAYTIVNYPSEVWNTATLVEALAVSGLPMTKAITTYSEGMEQTDLYRLADVFFVPVLTYIPFDWEYWPLEDENGVGMRFVPPHPDIGWIEIVIFDETLAASEAETLARQRLEEEGFSNTTATEPEESWSLVQLTAEDRSAADPAAWRVAHLHLGEHGGRNFYMLNLLNRLEAADGWETISEVVRSEWIWTDSWEPLRKP